MRSVRSVGAKPWATVQAHSRLIPQRDISKGLAIADGPLRYKKIMAKKDDMKIRLLAIERILKVGQVITSSEIIKELEGRFGITADRKTIYDDIRAISRIVPVECVSGKGGGYKLLNVLVETEQIPFDGSGYICPHNKECRCIVMNCGGCGWNPPVSKKRLDHIRQKM